MNYGIDALDEMDNLLKNANSLLKDWTYDEGKMKLNVKFVNKSKNPDPTYAKHGDSGFDLRANLDKEMIIFPGERALVPTGLYFQIPLNFELQVRPRSGLAIKNGITVLNSPGTVDSGYRGEVCVILYNTSNGNFTIKNNDRIAQGVIAPVQTLDNTIFSKVNYLDDSERGTDGFGSTNV